MNIVDKETNYLIKLDDLDIDYILNFNFQNYGASLNSDSAQNRASGDEYFEFEVMAEKIPDSNSKSDENDDDDTITYPVYRCEICDRDIPIAYRTEHNSSAKHKTCIKIIEAVCIRVQRENMVEENNEIVNPSSHNYFCEACAIIIKNTDKLLHEASEVHQKSVKHDSYLDYLVDVYVDIDNVDKIDLKPSQYNNDIKDCDKPCKGDEKTSMEKKIKVYGLNFDISEEAQEVQQKPLISNDCSLENNSAQNQIKEKDITMNVDSDDDLVDKVPTNERDPNTHDNSNKKPIDDNSTDENNLSKDDTSNKTNKKQNAIANVTPTNNSAVEVSDNTNKLNVNVTTENILSESNLKAYLDSITNYRYEVRPIHKLKLLNKDYIEIETLDLCTVMVKVNNFNGFFTREGRLQCRVCMVMVEDPIEHIYKINHLSNVRVPLEDVHCFRKINDSYKHCVHCNEIFSSSDYHKVSQSHLSALNNAISMAMPPSTSTKPDEPKKWEMKFCGPCNKQIHSHNFDAHTNGKAHTYNLSLFFTREIKTKEIGANNLKSDPRKIVCEPCNRKIPKNAFPFHLRGKHHMSSLTSVIESKADEDIFCDTCNLYTKKYTTHLAGAYHEYYVKETLKNTVGNPIKKSIPKPDYDHHIKITGTNKVYPAFCEVCNCKLFNVASTISEHAKGSTHKIKFRKLLDTNKIIKVDNSLYCKACKNTIESAKELDHIMTESHKNNLEQLCNEILMLQSLPPTEYHCESCDVDILNTTASIEEHENSFDHKVSVAFFKVQSKKITDYSKHYQYERMAHTVDALLCRICKLEIPVDQALNHLKAPNHNFKLRSLLIENKLQKVSNKYFCEICSVDVKNREELKHLQTPKHLWHKQVALTTAPVNTEPSSDAKRKWYCKVCKVSVWNAAKNIKMHNQGSTHKGKLKRLSLDDEEEVLMTKLASGRHMMCSLCELVVPVSGVKDHVRGAKHKAIKVLAIAENTTD